MTTPGPLRATQCLSVLIPLQLQPQPGLPCLPQGAVQLGVLSPAPRCAHPGQPDPCPSISPLLPFPGSSWVPLLEAPFLSHPSPLRPRSLLEKATQVAPLLKVPPLPSLPGAWSLRPRERG